MKFGYWVRFIIADALWLAFQAWMSFDNWLIKRGWKKRVYGNEGGKRLPFPKIEPVDFNDHNL